MHHLIPGGGGLPFFGKKLFAFEIGKNKKFVFNISRKKLFVFGKWKKKLFAFGPYGRRLRIRHDMRLQVWFSKIFASLRSAFLVWVIYLVNFSSLSVYDVYSGTYTHNDTLPIILSLKHTFLTETADYSRWRNFHSVKFSLAKDFRHKHSV